MDRIKTACRRRLNPSGGGDAGEGVLPLGKPPGTMSVAGAADGELSRGLKL
jgi:hypothetical protein